MRALKCAVNTKKLKRYGVLILLIFLVVALSGCVEDDAGEDEGLDLGEPVDVVTNYVGTEGFGIEGDVQDKLEGEGSLYTIVKEETEDQSSGSEIGHFAKFAEVTYLDKSGNEVIKYTINDEFVDLSDDEIKQLKAHSVDEDQITPLIKILPDGTYDCSELDRLTELSGWYPYIEGDVPTNTKTNNAIFGDNNGKPEIYAGIVLIKGVPKNIVIYNDAFWKKYGEMGIYLQTSHAEIKDP
jgi:hypothetical protein